FRSRVAKSVSPGKCPVSARRARQSGSMGTKRRAQALGLRCRNGNARGPAVANAYTTQFFQDQRDGSLASASIILPLLIDIFQPRSLIDIGCGQGTWSKTAIELGIEDQVGVDGAWAQPVLQIPHETFRPCDL